MELEVRVDIELDAASSSGAGGQLEPRGQYRGRHHQDRLSGCRPLATNKWFGILELLAGPQDLGDLALHLQLIHGVHGFTFHRAGRTARAGS